MLRNLIYVMAGGALGAALRYGVGLMCSHVRLMNMPVGTLTVNLIGCLALGMLLGLGERLGIADSGKMLMLTVGVCGAFTTFSTFSAETVRAMENGQLWQAVAYVTLSVAGGLMLMWLGKMIVK